MAESAAFQTLCLVYDSQQDRAGWVAPSVATTLMKVNPYIELIEENHRHFEAYARLAGPKPQIPIKEYNGGRWGTNDNSGSGNPPSNTEGDPS